MPGNERNTVIKRGNDMKHEELLSKLTPEEKAALFKRQDSMADPGHSTP